MGAKEILAKKFEVVLKGYRREEVDGFLREVSLSFSRLTKENEGLEQKLEVLADKIRDYRQEEDNIREAMVDARRMAKQLEADSKQKAEEIIKAAKKSADEILKKAGEDRQKAEEEGGSEIKTAKERAEEIIADANKKAGEIEVEMNLKTDVQKEILHRLTNEVSGFKQRILDAYKIHTGLIGKIPHDCENEYIKGVLSEEKPTFDKYAKQDEGKGTGADEAAESEKTATSTTTEETATSTTNEATATTEAAAAADAGATGAESVKFEVDVAEVLENDGKSVELPAPSETAELEQSPQLDNSKKNNEIFFRKNPNLKSKGGGKPQKPMYFGSKKDD